MHTCDKTINEHGETSSNAADGGSGCLINAAGPRFRRRAARRFHVSFPIVERRQVGMRRSIDAVWTVATPTAAATARLPLHHEHMRAAARGWAPHTSRGPRRACAAPRHAAPPTGCCISAAAERGTPASITTPAISRLSRNRRRPCTSHQPMLVSGLSADLERAVEQCSPLRMKLARRPGC